jgi:hypothetical protein
MQGRGTSFQLEMRLRNNLEERTTPGLAVETLWWLELRKNVWLRLALSGNTVAYSVAVWRSLTSSCGW